MTKDRKVIVRMSFDMGIPPAGVGDRGQKVQAQYRRDDTRTGPVLHHQEHPWVGADAVVVRSTEGGNYDWGKGGWDRAKADAVAIRYVKDSE